MKPPFKKQCKNFSICKNYIQGAKHYCIRCGKRSGTYDSMILMRKKRKANIDEPTLSKKYHAKKMREWRSTRKYSHKLKRYV